MHASPDTTVYRLHITLRHTNPSIWRRVCVAGDSTLAQLHRVIQVTMGWTDSHLHLFANSDGTLFGPSDVAAGGLPMEDETAVNLKEVLQYPTQRLTYEYDLGDSWEHDVVLECSLSVSGHEPMPVCTDGFGQCPPEDVDGVGGFHAFLDAINNPDHPEHKSWLAWWGKPDFDPAELDLAGINETLQAPKAFDGGAESFEDDAVEHFQGLSPATMDRLIYSPFHSPELLQWHEVTEVEQAPVTRMLEALFEFLRGKEIKLTAKGNLPMAVVNAMLDAGGRDALTELFPRELAAVRSEDDAAPVHVTRILAEIGGLTKVQRGRLSAKKKNAADPLKGQWSRPYLRLLEVMMREFNWAYLDGFPNLGGLQITAPFTFWMLQLHGAQWRPSQVYKDSIRQAFPLLEGEVEETSYTAADQILDGAIETRLLRLFRWFGLIETRPENTAEQRRGFNKPISVRRTPLFESVLTFQSEPPSQ